VADNRSTKGTGGGAELRQFLAVVSIGHPAETPEKGRKGLDEITFTNQYGLHPFEN